MYAYGNYIQVQGAEIDLNTCDNGIATTFSQSCRGSISDNNMKTVDLEYIGWVEEILAVNYSQFESIVLYCSWIQAHMSGARAIVKKDEFDSLSSTVSN